MDKNLSKSVKILVSEQIAIAAVYLLWTSFCFMQALINENVLEWFH